MKIYFNHPRGMPNAPEFAYATREEAEAQRAEYREIVELDIDVPLKDFRAFLADAKVLATKGDPYLTNLVWEYLETEFEKIFGEKL